MGRNIEALFSEVGSRIRFKSVSPGVLGKAPGDVLKNPQRA